MKYYLAMGTNLGNRYQNLSEAINFLRKLGTIEEVSPIYETAPVGMEGSPPDFYNLCLTLDSHLEPQSVLKEIKKIEEAMGRDIKNGHNLSRIIDIDIILSEESVISTEDLTLPHKEMHKRLFVLIPLKDILENFHHPILKVDISEMISRLQRGNQKITPLKSKSYS